MASAASAAFADGSFMSAPSDCASRPAADICAPEARVTSRNLFMLSVYSLPMCTMSCRPNRIAPPAKSAPKCWTGPRTDSIPDRTDPMPARAAEPSRPNAGVARAVSYTPAASPSAVVEATPARIAAAYPGSSARTRTRTVRSVTASPRSSVVARRVGQPVAIPKERRMSAAACEGGPSSPVWNWIWIAAPHNCPSWPSDRASQNSTNSSESAGLGSIS